MNGNRRRLFRKGNDAWPNAFIVVCNFQLRFVEGKLPPRRVDCLKLAVVVLAFLLAEDDSYDGLVVLSDLKSMTTKSIAMATTAKARIRFLCRCRALDGGLGR